MYSVATGSYVAFNNIFNQYKVRCLLFYARWFGNSCQHLAIIRHDTKFSIDSLWPSDATWRINPGQVINGLCLMAPIYCLNQVWKILIYDYSCISPGQWVKGFFKTFAVCNQVPVRSIQHIFLPQLYFRLTSATNIFTTWHLYIYCIIFHIIGRPWNSSNFLDSRKGQYIFKKYDNPSQNLVALLIKITQILRENDSQPCYEIWDKLYPFLHYS